MTGYDIQKFENFKQICIRNKIMWKTSGDMIHLNYADKCLLGSFSNVSSALDYLFGFETGYSKGRTDAVI
jgi:hypothetical protein